VRASFLARDRTYGVRRVWYDLLAEGVSCGMHRVEAIDAATSSRGAAATTSPSFLWGERQASGVASTCSTAPSKRQLPTANGSLTSLTSGRQKAGFI
jgi:hypothetical protein